MLRHAPVVDAAGDLDRICRLYDDNAVLRLQSGEIHSGASAVKCVQWISESPGWRQRGCPERNPQHASGGLKSSTVAVPQNETTSTTCRELSIMHREPDVSGNKNESLRAAEV